MYLIKFDSTNFRNSSALASTESEQINNTSPKPLFSIICDTCPILSDRIKEGIQFVVSKYSDKFSNIFSKFVISPTCGFKINENGKLASLNFLSAILKLLKDSFTGSITGITLFFSPLSIANSRNAISSNWRPLKYGKYIVIKGLSVH